MKNYVKETIYRENIIKVELFCSLNDDKNLIETLQEVIKVHHGKRKIIFNNYLKVMKVVKKVNKNLNLEGIMITLDDGDRCYLSTYDILENKVVLSDNSLQFMINILNFVYNEQSLEIKTLDLESLDYVSYNEEKTLTKTRG